MQPVGPTRVAFSWKTCVYLHKTLKQSHHASATSPQLLFNWVLENAAGVHRMSLLTVCQDRTGYQVFSESQTPVMLVRCKKHKANNECCTSEE